MKIAQIMIAVLLILTGCTSIAEEDRALITENRELAVQAQEVSLASSMISHIKTTSSVRISRRLEIEVVS